MFGVIIVVGLISVFFISWGESFSTYRKHQASRKETRVLLSISDYVRNGTISHNNEPAIITKNMLQENLSPYLNSLRRVGMEISVEVVVHHNSTVFNSKKYLEGPTRSVSLPIIYENSEGRVPAKLNVRMEV